MIARIVLKKGNVIARHLHPTEQIAYVEVGALKFVLGEEGSISEKIVRAGEILVIPANLPHSVEALEDTNHLDISPPPRGA